MASKRGAAKEKPDLEEALEGSGDDGLEVVDADANEDDEEADLSKDRYVKQPKKKKKKTGGGRKGKKGGDGGDEEGDEEEGEGEKEKPKKVKGKGRK